MSAPVEVSFYPAQSSDDRAFGVRPTLSEWVFQALGAASTCWGEDGIFESERAKDIGDSLMAELRRRGVAE